MQTYRREMTMATIQVRDVPDEVADVIAEKARAKDMSISGYLRELLAATVADELRRRAMRRWLAELQDLHARVDLSPARSVSGAELVREAREAYESDET
jgi:post-segregation antitoxin (ccd killing protein)